MSPILTRISLAIIDVNLAIFPSPSGLAHTLVVDQLVDADTVLARTLRAQIDLVLASFSSKTWRARAAEVVHQIGTVCSQQTRFFGAVVHVNVTNLAFPTWETLAHKSTLFESDAGGAVVARVTIGCARIDLDVQLDQHILCNTTNCSFSLVT